MGDSARRVLAEAPVQTEKYRLGETHTVISFLRSA